MEVDALKKLLGDLKGVVEVATAQAWEWRTLQREMKPCPSYALLSVTGVAGLTILPWFGKEQSLLVWVMELSILCF